VQIDLVTAKILVTMLHKEQTEVGYHMAGN
jgi:hypothetical protein